MQHEQGLIAAIMAGNDARMVAAVEGFPEATDCLLQLGADPTMTNDSSMTAMEFVESG